MGRGGADSLGAVGAGAAPLRWPARRCGRRRMGSAVAGAEGFAASAGTMDSNGGRWLVPGGLDLKLVCGLTGALIACGVHREDCGCTQRDQARRNFLRGSPEFSRLPLRRRLGSQSACRQRGCRKKNGNAGDGAPRRMAGRDRHAENSERGGDKQKAGPTHLNPPSPGGSDAPIDSISSCDSMVTSCNSNVKPAGTTYVEEAAAPLAAGGAGEASMRWRRFSPTSAKT